MPMLTLVFSLLAFLGCVAQAQGPSAVSEKSVLLPMQRVFTELYTGIDQPSRLVIRNLQQWQSIWRALSRGRYPTVAPPAVDFSRSMVILVGMGMRSTGGYAICIEGVSRDDGRLFVVVRQVSPASDAVTTQALSAPVDAVQVPRSDNPVTFVERQETQHCD